MKRIFAKILDWNVLTVLALSFRAFAMSLMVLAAAS